MKYIKIASVMVVFNFLNTLDILDIIITVNLVMNNEYLYYADINEDSIVNILDIIQMVNSIL